MQDREELFQLLLEVGKHLHHEPTMNKMNMALQGEKAITSYLETFGPVYSGDLAVQMEVGTGRIANALKSLEKKKLIIRVQDDEDKRKMKVMLTDNGHEFALANIQDIKNKFNRFVDIYGEERVYRFLLEAEEIHNVLEKLKKGDEQKC